MQLPENEVHVWYFNVEDFSEEINMYRHHLSSEEIARSNKFKFEKDRILNIMSRSALRRLSSQYLGQAPNTFEFKYGTYGKPDYDFPTELKFNVSHSGKMIVLAFLKNSEIGVDVEKIKADFDVLKLAESFFSPMEIKMLRDVEQNDLYKAFYRCWTRKESFIKAKGSGLSFPLASFTVSIEDTHAELLSTEWNSQEKLQWKLFSFKPDDFYIGALTVGKNIRSVKYFDWSTFLKSENFKGKN